MGREVVGVGVACWWINGSVRLGALLWTEIIRVYQMQLFQLDLWFSNGLELFFKQQLLN